MYNLDTLRGRFDGLKEAENGKDTLIEELFGCIESSQKELRDLQLNFEQKNDLVDIYQTRLKACQDKLKVKQRTVDGNAYVSVLIDGDSLNLNMEEQFVDKFVTGKEQGGQEAVRQLKKSVMEYVRNLDDCGVDVNAQIVIRVYANFKGLGKTYQGAKILDNWSDLYLFARGFNMGDQLCDFVDAGDGKECSDVKICDNFKLDVNNVHCKHIIFGGPGDNGYARLLGPYSGDDNISHRVTMIEGPPFAAELRRLADKFQRTKFTSVFRETKLPSRKVSYSSEMRITPPTSPGPTYASAAGVLSKSPRTSPIQTGVVLASNGISQQYQLQQQHQKKKQANIFRNSKDERVDIPLKASENIIKILKQRKLCNQYHILGECGYSSCTHVHGARLSNLKDVEALRFIARLSPCGLGLGCDTESCVAGHQCPRPGCQGGDCRFPREMHGVDKRIA